MGVEIEIQDVSRVIADNLTIVGGASIGPSEIDNVRGHHYWGVSVFSTQAGTLLIEYKVANVAGIWRSFPLINIAANTPFDQVYRKTRENYRVTYTDTSLVASDVDLITNKSW